MDKRFILLLVVLAGIAAHGLYDALSQPSPAAANPTAADLDKEKRYRTVIAVARHIKNQLREPDSVEWIDLLADDPADTVCIRYRARNGFGGMSVETLAVTADASTSDPSAWRRHCTGAGLHNIRYARLAI